MKFLNPILSLGLIFVSQLGSAQVAMREKIVLDKSNAVVLRGVVNDDSVGAATRELVNAAVRRGGAKYPLYLVLDSPGGSIDSGNDLIEFAKTIPNLKTVTVFGASMASAITEALPGERLVTNHAYLMFHRASGGFSGQFEMGEVEQRLAAAKRMVQRLERQNYTRMRMSQEDYKRLVKDELWLDAQQSLEYRAADRIVDIYCTKDLIDSIKTVTIPLLFGTARVKFSGCPLLRAPTGENRALYQIPSTLNYKTKFTL